MRNQTFKTLAGLLAVPLVALLLVVGGPAGAVDDETLTVAQTGVAPVLEQPSPADGRVPGDTHGNTSTADMWRSVRGGMPGSISIPDTKGAILIQSEGEEWRSIRNGPMTVIGIYAMGGMGGILALYFMIHGPIRTDSGASGRMVARFSVFERFVHWLVGVTFILLALSGLNLLYGKYVLLPLLGPEVFALITGAGKYVHNFGAFPFMAGLVLMFLIWVRRNLPRRGDLSWLLHGGGMLSHGTHLPAGKFNAGEKIVFWLAIAGGVVLSLTGLALLMPFEFRLFNVLFAGLNAIGFDLPSAMTAVHEMHLAQLVHGAAALILITVILGHIYLGTVGMQGAFNAMIGGKVDENWAREHHSLWAREVGVGKPKGVGHA